MTKEKIIQAALVNFSEHGYSGGSLAQIAEEVGIRKQSIYTYFKSKDELYLSISNQAMEAELLFAKEFIAKHQQLPVEKVLLPFLQSFQQRFESIAETKFFMRSIFLMPQHLEQQLSEQTYIYLDELERLFTDYLKNSNCPFQRMTQQSAFWHCLIACMSKCFMAAVNGVKSVCRRDGPYFTEE